MLQLTNIAVLMTPASCERFDMDRSRPKTANNTHGDTSTHGTRQRHRRIANGNATVLTLQQKLVRFLCSARLQIRQGASTIHPAAPHPLGAQCGPNRTSTDSTCASRIARLARCLHGGANVEGGRVDAKRLRLEVRLASRHTSMIGSLQVVSILLPMAQGQPASIKLAAQQRTDGAV